MFHLRLTAGAGLTRQLHSQVCVLTGSERQTEPDPILVGTRESKIWSEDLAQVKFLRGLPS